MKDRPREERHPEDRPVSDAQRIAELEEQVAAGLIERAEADERIAEAKQKKAGCSIRCPHPKS